MKQRYNFADFILPSFIVLALTSLMAVVDAQAQIAFVSQRDGNPEIYVMDTDGKNQRRLTNNRHDDWSPSWSPDGKRIAFHSDRDGHVKNGIPTDEIYVMDADGGNPQNLTNSPFFDDRHPSWSPDSKRIAFVSNRDGHVKNGIPTDEIYVMDADGGNPQNLTNSPFFDDRHPSWSPDSKRIAFDSNRDKDNPHKRQIYVMDADGGNQQRLTENLKTDWLPSWSPNGERIAYASYRVRVVTSEIYVMDTDGGNQQRLTENLKTDWQPSWSPNGERIAYASDRKGDFENFEIYVMDADGGNQQRLTENRDSDLDPAWFNSPFSVSSTGKEFTMWGCLKQVAR